MLAFLALFALNLLVGLGTPSLDGGEQAIACRRISGFSPSSGIRAVRPVSHALLWGAIRTGIDKFLTAALTFMTVCGATICAQIREQGARQRRERS